MNHATILAQPNAGEASRLSPLAAFVAWVASLIRTIAGMKRRKVFPPNWQDHWQGLRQCEWLQHQLLGFCVQHLLAGHSLDDLADVPLVMEVPDSYGGRCPSTPEAMNRRFIQLQRFRLDPEACILRHLRRLAKREHLDLVLDASGCPLRLVRRAASPAFHAAVDSRCSLSTFAATRRGMQHARSCRHTRARAPPHPSDCRLPATASDARRLRSRPLA
jgi:hypothetical protein